MKSKLILTIICLLACVFALATLVSAAEYTAATDSEFSTAYANAVDGDTIIITNSLNGTFNFGKSIKYVLSGDGIVWHANANNEAAGKVVEITSVGGNNTFKPNSGMWCNSYGLTVKDLSSTSWTLSASANASLCLDMSVIDGRLFYGTFLKEINLKGNVSVTKLSSTYTSGDTHYIKCTTLNIYDGVKIYGNKAYKPLIDVTNLNLYGGEIYGNVCTGMWPGVTVKNLTMLSGSIYGNYQPDPHGTYTNPNDPQCVAYISADESAYIYDGTITGNFVGMGHDKSSGTVSGLACRYGTKNLYIRDGLIHSNILVTHGKFGAFALNSQGYYTSEIDHADYLYVTENPDGTFTYEKQYSTVKFNVTKYSYSVIFFGDDGAPVQAFMVKDNQDLLKALDGSDALSVPIGKWTNDKNSCVITVPVLTVQATYYTAIDHTPSNDDFDCTTALYCSSCKAVIFEACGAHAAVESLTYANLCAYGVYTYDCTNPGCSINDIAKESAPIVTMLGYSVTEATTFDKISMVQSFFVNPELLESYNRINKVNLQFGVVASSEKYASPNPIYAENGQLVKTNEDKVILYMGKSNSHEIKVVGIDPQNSVHTSTKLVWCGFAFDGEKILYIDNGNTYENAPFISYSELILTL